MEYRKKHKLTPLNKEISKIERALWHLENGTENPKKDELPYELPQELICYWFGLKNAHSLVKNGTLYKAKNKDK